MKDLTWRAWRYKEILCKRKSMMMTKDRKRKKWNNSLFNKVFVMKGNIRKTQMICAWNNVMIIWTEIWAQQGQISLKHYLGSFYRLFFDIQNFYIISL